MSDTDSEADFREGMIKKRLRGVRHVLLVLSGKGGVGKSVVSAALAAQLADAGLGVGLLDADIYGPSSALLFGVDALPEEGKGGLRPPSSRDVKIMSVDLFASGRPVPLTGYGARQVLVELLALTDWGKLDCLIADMPPATGDIMQLLTSLGNAQPSGLVVTMADKLSTAVAHRVLQLLRAEKVPIVGVLENMRRATPGMAAGGSRPAGLAREFEVPLLGALPFDPGVTAAVEDADIRALLSTRFAKELRLATSAYKKTLRTD
jgi:ATP-binding protein involved in chromosome partitioning